MTQATEQPAGEAAEPLPPDLLAILVCPACHAVVQQAGARLICQGCGRKYPIEDGIPIMLIDRAES